MLVAIADTHAVIWYIFDDKRLSATAREFLDNAAKAKNRVGFSSITLAEIVYLVEKGRIRAETMTRLSAALDSPNSVLTDVPFDRHIAQALPRVERVERLAVPDLPDRVIAATALHLGVQLISRDGQICLSNVKTIW
jgi:PIN domain nuclease of toxin-antitoxin system